MRRKVIQTLERYNMLEGAKQIVVGFSGGADSTALLYLLHIMREELGITVSACHLNHRLRGEESMRDERFVRDFCKRYGIPLVAESIQAEAEAKDSGQSVELYSREKRYALFEREAARYGRAKIATAHNLNDNAETLLFYLARGTGLNGMGGIPPVRGNIIRPLIECSRAEIEQFCRDNGLEFVTDSTNLADLYTRNRIRHHLVPMMEEINSGFLGNAAKLAMTAREENSFMEYEAQKAFTNLKKDGGIDRSEFLKLHPALRRRVLLKLVPDIGFDKVCELDRRIEESDAKTEIRHGITVEIKGGIIRLNTKAFYRDERQPYFEKPFAEGETELFPGKQLQIRLVMGEEYKLFFKKDPAILKNTLDYDKIKDIAVIRGRKDGDRMTPYNKNMSRPLKKMWNESKTPQSERWRAAIISDSEGVLWAENFGCDKRAAPDADSKRIALVTVKEE